MRLLIFLIFIFSSFSAYSEIEGKGLICKCFLDTVNGCKKNKPYLGQSPFIGIFFENDKVYIHYLIRLYVKNKSKLLIEKDIGASYYEGPAYIQWPRPNGIFQNYNAGYFFDKGTTSLDRQTLILRNEYYWSDYTYDRIKYDCNSTDLYTNPINNKKAFNIEIDKFRQEGQKIENEIKKRNKF